jgi:hypothetical protein
LPTFEKLLVTNRGGPDLQATVEEVNPIPELTAA